MKIQKFRIFFGLCQKFVFFKFLYIFLEYSKNLYFSNFWRWQMKRATVKLLAKTSSFLLTTSWTSGHTRSLMAMLSWQLQFHKKKPRKNKPQNLRNSGKFEFFIFPGNGSKISKNWSPMLTAPPRRFDRGAICLCSIFRFCVIRGQPKRAWTFIYIEINKI